MPEPFLIVGLIAATRRILVGSLLMLRSRARSENEMAIRG